MLTSGIFNLTRVCVIHGARPSSNFKKIGKKREEEGEKKQEVKTENLRQQNVNCTTI